MRGLPYNQYAGYNDRTRLQHLDARSLRHDHRYLRRPALKASVPRMGNPLRVSNFLYRNGLETAVPSVCLGPRQLRESGYVRSGVSTSIETSRHGRLGSQANAP